MIVSESPTKNLSSFLPPKVEDPSNSPVISDDERILIESMPSSSPVVNSEQGTARTSQSGRIIKAPARLNV